MLVKVFKRLGRVMRRGLFEARIEQPKKNWSKFENTSQKPGDETELCLIIECLVDFITKSNVVRSYSDERVIVV